MKVGKNTQQNTATQITQVTTERRACLYTAVSKFLLLLSFSGLKDPGSPSFYTLILDYQSLIPLVWVFNNR